MSLEQIESRLLLSADLSAAEAGALGAGIDALGARFDDFLSLDGTLGERVPVLLNVTKLPDNTLVNEAPTIRDLFSVPVDANGDGKINPFSFDTSDDDETTLQLLDAAGNADGKVTADEFLKPYFFDAVSNWFNTHSGTDARDNFVSFLKGNVFFSPDRALHDLSGYFDVDFSILDAKVSDTTQTPDAEVTFTAGFELKVTRYVVPIDLGLEADALKLLSFTGNLDGVNPPNLPTVPVTSTLDFSFDFGVHTGGETVVDQNDFFVRKADPLALSVASAPNNLNFNLNIGFLGAQVKNGSLDLNATVDAHLLDPNDPAVLGFTDAQRGVESTSGIVTAAGAVPNADLSHSAGFFLRIGNVGINTAVSVADNNRASISDLQGDITSALNSAGLGSLVNVSLVGGDTIRLSLVSTSNNPLGFANESLSSGGALLATPNGDVAGHPFEYSSDQTFLLSVGGTLPKLVSVKFADASHTDIGFNDGQAASVPPVLAPAAPSVFDISADATFTVTVWKNDGTSASSTVTLHASDTDGNTTAGDLAADLDNAFQGTPVYPLILASANIGGHLQFSAFNSSVSAIRVQASGTATSEMGFAADSTMGLQLVGANNATADLSQAAHFRLTLNDGGVVTTYVITVPDNNRGSLASLASDIDAAIDAAIGADRVNAFASGGKIVLAGNDTNVRSLSVTTLNQTLGDLVDDVNGALAAAGLSGQVTASSFSGQLRLLASQSLEISKTLTFDAGRTFAELQPTLANGPLIGSSKGTASHVLLKLPIEVNPGVLDAHNPGNDWQPAHLAIVGNFSPFDADSNVADYDASAKRFDLNFTLDPTEANQDTPVGSVPTPASLTDEVRLVNLAEPLNFNHVSAESMVGLVSSLGTALQQIADANPFSKFAIPFTGATLSDLMNFVDPDKSKYSGLIDTLLYDTGGDGLGGANADADRLVKKVTVGGNDRLVPAFTTAQTLAARLSALLNLPQTGAGGINATYDTANNELTYRVDLLPGSRTATAVKTPFDYNVLLDPFGNVSVDAAAPLAARQVDLDGRSAFQGTLGVDLSPPGSVIFGTTKLSDLNAGNGIGVKLADAITGTVNVPPVPTVPPAAPPVVPVQQLPSGDAVFTIAIAGGATKQVTVSQSSTFNRSMADLVADVNNALAAAGIDKVVADSDGRRLVLTATDATTTFSLTSVNAAATADLGFVAGTASDKADLIVTDSAGVAHRIALDGLSSSSTVQNFFDLIATATGGKVTADFNATHTGLRLVDNSGGLALMTAQTVNGSIALLQLGFHEARDLKNVVPAHDILEGGSIGSTKPLDQRFFVRDAEMRIDGLTVQTAAAGVPGQALFGIVGVDTHMAGSVEANVSARLQNPTSKVAGSQVTLKELFDKSSDAVAAPVVATGQTIDFSPFAGSFTVGTRVTSSSGGTAVVVGVESGTLHVADVEGAFNHNDSLSQGGAIGIEIGGVKTNAHYGDLTLGVHVQDGFNELGFGPGFALLDGKSYDVGVALTGFGEPMTPTKAAASLDLSGIGDLAAFQKLNYKSLADALHGLLGVVQGVESNFELLNRVLPAINRSVSDLLGLTSGFASGVTNADASFNASQAALDPGAKDLPALRLQDLPRALRSAFGLPTGVDPSTPGAVDWVKLDFDKAGSMLLVDLSLSQSVSTKLGLDIVIGGGLPDVTSADVLKVSGLLNTRLNFGIDLATPSNAYLFDSSTISGALHVEGEGQQYTGGQTGLGLVFRAALGPLDVFIQDGDASIDVSFKLPGLNFAGGKKLISAVTFSDWKSPVVDKNDVEIFLPMFFGGEGPDNFIGQFKATGPIETVVVVNPDFSGISAAIQNNTLPFDPFSNVLLAIDGLDIYLQTLSDTLSSEVLGLNMPFVGKQLADATFIEDFRNTLIRTLKNGIENAVNPDPDTIVQALITAGAGAFLSGSVTADNTNAHNPTANLRSRTWTFTLKGKKTITVDDFQLGVPNLGFDVAEPVSVVLDWQMTLGFGVDFSHSAYVVLPNGTDDIDLKLAITLPAGTASGQLGYLPLDVTDPNSDTGVKLDFDVDVKDGATTNVIMPFSDLAQITPIATVKGTDLAGGAHAATLHIVTHASPGLPEMRTDLAMDWSLAGGTLVSSLDGNAVAPGIGKIALNNVVLDAGSVAEQLLGPAFSDVADFIKPFMPVIDTLSARIPILSDIAGTDITLLDLAQIFGHVDGDFIKAVADVFNVISSINDFLNAPDLTLGSLTLFDKAGGITNFNPANPGASLASIVLVPGSQGLSLDPGFDAAIALNGFLKSVKDGSLAKGLTMPILTDQLEGFKLLLDQPATLIEYALPPLSVDFSYLQVFPVFGPLAVSITISFGFDVALNGVGFDTFGYQRYADGGFRNPGVIFDGFFFDDLSGPKGSQVDTPEVTMQFGLIGAAELNLGIARAGVQGGIDALINFNWHDSIPDGHVHLSEIAGNILANGPLAAFDVSGQLSFELSAFLEISLIGFHQDFPITGPTKLYGFEDPAARDPILATRLADGTLQLNMGVNAQDRLNGDISDGNENFSVEAVGSDVYVWSDKLGVSESNKQKYQNINHIVGLAGQGDDTILLTGFDGSAITSEFDGGIGDDHIEFVGSTGSRSAPGAIIRGGIGNDTLIGGDANDVIYGGQGNDIIKGGGGYDILFGDDGRVASTFISSRIASSDGDDTIEGGAGDDVLIGGGGNDKLKGDAGNDVLIGDGGRFDYTSTGGHVDIATMRPAAYVPTPVTVPKDPAIISNEIDAIYDAVTARFTATDLGFGGNDTLEGGDNDDILIGGSGDDVLKGDGGADIILGGKGFDDIHGGDGNDTIFGGEQADTIEGNDGADVISGGSGNDFIHGNDGNDVMKGDSGADVMFGDAGDDQIFGMTEPDVLFGGIGNDLVVGGTGNDIMFGDDGLVAKLDPNNVASGDVVIGNGSPTLLNGAFRDNDKRTLDLIVTDVVAGDGNDMMSGDAGEDIMLGGGGNDLMGGDVDPRLTSAGTATSISKDVLIGDGGKVTFNQRQFRSIETVIASVGSTYDDTIYGDNGNDYIFGGQGSDFLFGGHGKVVTGGTVGAFRGVTDTGAADNDIIVGDNGEMLFANATIAANFGKLERVRTTDVTNATGGHEYAEGELGDDVIFGGVNASVDTLFGNAGNDVILGDDGVLDFDFNDAAHDLTTLDLIRSYTDNLGGEDHISGNAGGDVIIGGTGGDLLYGDDPSGSAGAADGEDVMLGDNGDIFLIGTVGRLTVKVAGMPTGTAVDLITTSDVLETTGGADTMSGNAGNDIMLGGVNNGGIDQLYGDIAAPTALTIANDGNDILLGDNGLLDFTYGSDTDRTTLDLIRSSETNLGGVDTISGDKGLDVAIGGKAGDTIYGDDANFSAGAADLADILIGDNADIFLVAKGSASGPDLKDVMGAAVKTIRTTDTLHPEYGGVDTISGNAGGDIILGGVQGDILYGDRSAPTSATNANDGDDIILGDNGALEWLSTGRLNEVLGIDIQANNAALWAKFGTGTADTDLGTLDLITTEQPTNGGRDLVYGDNGRDTILGGTDVDTLYGDTGSEADGIQSTSGNDLMFGDHGRLYPQFSALTSVNSRNFFAIDTGNAAGGQGDLMWGEEGDDVMLGQQGDDRMWGGSGNDDMIGGHNVAGGWDELAGAIATVLKTPDNAMNDLMDGGSGDDAMTGDNAIVWRRGDDLSPRFRALTSPTIYTTTDTTITANVGSSMQSDPNDVVGRDIQLLDHSDAVQANPQGRFGQDVMAGGAGNDTMFGELGDDLMQGDGSIGVVLQAMPASRTITVTDSAGPTGQTLYFNVPEAATDGDDYMEGNGGRDLMYGGLGQDDMIGGSSALFGLVTEAMRPDDSDTMFGGAGIDVSRNDIGDATEDPTTHVITTTATGHARDADFMMGDNANVYRLVTGGASGTNPADAKDKFLTFNYDNYDTSATPLRIVPRAMQQLDYTLGGGDYAGGGYNALGQATPTGQSVADNGAADLMHGESGDDVMFGMTGSDVLFGEGQDDDMVGGYGNDWMSGGTGQDGLLGDDGLILTSRNSTTGEPLNGVAGLLATDPDSRYSNGNVLNESIATPGSIQTALINVTGDLKKTMDLVPFSFDKGWVGTDDEFPNTAGNTPYADDILFGGLGSDFMHGGSGDDAISGAEALDHAFVPVYDTSGNASGVYDLGYGAVGIANALVLNPTHMNSGDVLAFNPIDTNGQHLNNRFRAGEFRLYDEYDPLRKVQLDSSGNLWKSSAQGTAYEFILNFNKDEGVVRPAGTVPKATGQQTSTYPAVRDDGGDAIFGDLGNDWLVGGTGRDDAYGGWGNDLINVDDDQTTNGNLNDVPDTHPTYEDRAYGGAGRDVLIANTGGDRLIDWVGEYNSYLVPFAPFGQATVSRTLQPFLPEFLYALSKADGADTTRAAYTGDPRNGEPKGEMGLVLQKDIAWQDQTGAPSDPQAGNIPGGKRDVLRSADFTGNTANGFMPESGAWLVQNDRYEVSPSSTSTNKDAISLFDADVSLPSYFELSATINAVKPIAGFKANAYLVFDYYGPNDFKFAGIDISNNKIELGQRTANGWQVLASANALLKQDTDYNVLLAVNGTAVTLVLNNSQSISFAYQPHRDADGFTYNINAGMYGLGADNAKARIDNVLVQVVPPAITLSRTDDFATAPALVAPATGSWSPSAGYLVGTPAAGQPMAIAVGSLSVHSAYLLQLTTKISTSTVAGIVFDEYSATDFKWAAIDKAAGRVLIGHYTARSGWVVDAAVARTFDATDVTLTATLKGSTISLMIGTQSALSFTFNSVITDGAYGLIARGGAAKFDFLTVRTDDPAFATTTAAPALMAASQPTQAAAVGGPALTQREIEALAAEAMRRWSLSKGEAFAAALAQVPIEIADLPGQELGQYVGGAVFIDSDAAGRGWFIDPTPRDDREFDNAGDATHGLADDRIDLLSVIAHELGHAGGLDHQASGVMADALATGHRSVDLATLLAAGQPSWDTPRAAAADDHRADSPVIDWSNRAAVRPAVAAPRPGTQATAWQSRFVNHLGATPERLNPNASLKVQLAAAPKVGAL